MPPRNPRLLIADDEPLYLETTSQLLTKAGFECVCVADAKAAVAALREQQIDLLLTDLNMPGNLKLELLRSGRSQWPEVPVIVVTGVPSLPTAIAARAIHRASRRRAGPFQVIDCTAIPESLFESLLFGHAKGAFTGAAQDQPGLLVRSDGGTTFFDEIGELPLTLQPKLLRVIQEQTFMPVGKTKPIQLNTRFICATNRNLLAEVDEGRFRQDLFYRLSVLHLELPPLRERGDDVIELAQHFLDQLAGPEQRINGFTDACLRRLRSHPWPGNARELRNAVESAIALCRSSRIDVDDLPAWIVNPERSPTESAAATNVSGTVLAMSRNQALGCADKRYFETLLASCEGNISRAARHAGLSRQTLHKHLKKHNIAADKFRPSA